MQSWIDAHCHLAEPLLSEQQATLEPLLKAHGCTALIMAGIDPKDWQRQLHLDWPSLTLIPSFGVHPWAVHEGSDEDLAAALIELTRLLPKALGVGEIGLDYFRAKTTAERDKQKLWFDRQLALALAHSREKPLILHVVKAHYECLQLLKPYRKKFKGMVHSFWAGPEVARQYLDLGFLLSIPPRVRFRDDHDLLKHCRQDDLVFESDSPYQHSDGSVTTPLVLLEVFQKIAHSWGVSVDTVIEGQWRNLSGLFPNIKSRRPHL